MYTCIQTHTQIHIIHTHEHTRTHMYTYACTLAHRRMDTHRHRHTCTHTQTHAHRCMHTHTYTRTHIHTSLSPRKASLQYTRDIQTAELYANNFKLTDYKIVPLGLDTQQTFEGNSRWPVHSMTKITMLDLY